MCLQVHMYDRLPSYFIYAGLVFVPLTQPYLQVRFDLAYLVNND